MPLLPHMSESSQDGENSTIVGRVAPPPSASPVPSVGTLDAEGLVVTGDEVGHCEHPGKLTLPIKTVYTYRPSLFENCKIPYGRTLTLAGGPGGDTTPN